ncbi:UV radiation resistance protein and autophagy-related subunit 14-domain-containing protein [Rhodocollybia butyracea]|uniref:Autophagy-related protein 14 n=1 Tax=Rhodocollybia butyracea TaxID=206335 RepID=A0A9P5UCB3_9AGAR|nr:UV radiation resistance protein and autophagy-related subunit 14-domain-containing protein [Rhodocollybia butyracea]
MECKICQLQQRTFFCDSCVRNHLRDFKQQTAFFALERDAAVSKATDALGTGGTTGMESARVRRADVSSMERRVSELMDGLVTLKKDNEKKRERLQTLRSTLAERRQTLTAAKQISPAAAAAVSSSLPSSAPTSPAILSAHSSLASLLSSIARARNGLVQELVEVFGITHESTHSNSTNPSPNNLHWTIGTLILPVPGDMRRYPPDHINAVLTLTIHFVNLLAFYLGVKLPFEVTWMNTPGNGSKTSRNGNSGNVGKLGVGVPYIGAINALGNDSGGWARWHHKHPLHVSASSSSSSPSTPSSPFTSISIPYTLQSHSASSSDDADSPSASTVLADSSVAENNAAESMTDSMILPPPGATKVNPSSTSSSSSPTFTTGIAMLLYNVAYLAYTQHGVTIPLHQVASGDVLGNLWAVCFGNFGGGSAGFGLGRYSHETAASLTPSPLRFPLTRLPPPTPPAFGLEFRQLLQATSRPAAKVPISLAPPASGQATELNSPLSAKPTLNSNAPPSHPRGKASPKISKRRVSEVSLAKDIVKSRRTGDLDEVFENDDGDGREDEDGWDLV